MHHCYFLLRAPAHYSFTFNSQFLYVLNHKINLSKTMSGIFHFRFRLAFIKVYIFIQQKNMDSLSLKLHNSFHYKNNTKTT